MISRMEWAAGRKLRANAGETLTEVLISVLVIALGMMPTRQAHRRITGRDSIRSYCM